MMNKNKRSVFVINLCICLIVLSGFAFVNQADAKTITLKMITMGPPPEQAKSALNLFVERVNSKAKGELVINWQGGMEVMPLHQQANALKMGIIDVGAVPASQLAQMVPESRALALAKTKFTGIMNPLLERETGFYKTMQGYFQEGGLHYLGRANTTVPMYLWLNKKIDTLDDLSNTLIGHGSGFYGDFVRKLGAKSVALAPPDTYSAMDRGTVVGCIQPGSLALAISLNEVSEYMVMPPMYAGNANVLVMNLKSWKKKVPDHLKPLFEEAAKHAEYWAGYIDMGARVEQEQLLTKLKGVKVIELNRADQGKIRSTFTDLSLKLMKKKVKPDRYEKLVEMIKLEK